jgi:hypothetical protein
MQAISRISFVFVLVLALGALYLPPSHADEPCYEVNEEGVLHNGSSCVGTITIPPSVGMIGSSAFAGSGLTSVTIPGTVTEIGDYAFQNNTSLTSITIPPSVGIIGSYAFAGSGLTSVTIPGTVTEIGVSAFQQMTSLSSVTIQEGVTLVPANAFLNSTSLAHVSLPNSLTMIGDNAFYSNALTTLMIPNSVTSIGSYAFAVNRALTSITIGSNVTSIGTAAFQDVTALTALSFLGEEPPSIGSWAFNLIPPEVVVSVPSTAEGYVAGYDGLWNGLTVSRIVAPTISLSPSSEEKTVNTVISGYTIGVTGDTVTSFSISPTAPSGLSFNTSTGLLTGTPNSVASPTTFTITARNVGGSSTATFTLTVRAVSRASENSDDKAAAEAAAERAAAAQQAARTSILASLKTGEELTLGSFTQAGISGITAGNFQEFQIELRSLPESSRSDINEILKIAYKFEIVDKIGSERVNHLPPKVFIEINLIDAGNRNKVALVAAVRKLPLVARDSFAEIKLAIEEQALKIQARKDRLAAVIARNAQRSLASTQP